MDDALRDSELAIAHWWSELGYIREAKLQFTAKGIVRGWRADTPTFYADAADVLDAGAVTSEAAEYVLFKMRLQSASDSEDGLPLPFQAR